MTETTKTRISNQGLTRWQDLTMSERIWKEYLTLEDKAIMKKVFAVGDSWGVTFGTLFDHADASDLDGAKPAARMLKARGPEVLKAFNENAAKRIAARKATFEKRRIERLIDLNAKPTKKAPAKKTAAKKPAAKRQRKTKTA